MNIGSVSVSFIMFFILGFMPLGCTLKGEISATELMAELKAASSLSYYTNNPDIKVQLVFNRAPQSIRSEEIALTNATFNGIEKINETTYIVRLSPQAQGLITMRLPEGAALGAYGEKSLDSDTYEIFFDDTIPSISTAQILPGAVSSHVAPYVDGDTEPGALVTLYNSITCSGQILADMEANAQGHFNFSVAKPLETEGSYSWSVLASDKAGNKYCYPYPLPYTLDRTPPSAPVIALAYGAIQDNPVGVNINSCDDLKQSSQPFYKVIFIQDGEDLPFMTDARWVDCSTGLNNFLLSGADGNKNITLWARDEAGNVSASNTLTVKLDTITPTLAMAATVSLNRNSANTLLLNDAAVTASEEGAGVYTLSAASSPACSSYGSVAIDSATGAFSYAPTAHYYNSDNGMDYNGGPCHIKVRFSDLVSPTPHYVEKEVAVSVLFVDEAPHITAWPGTNGTATESCGNKCFANAIFDLAFTATPGGDPFLDPQNLTCSATTSEGYYVDVASCSVAGTTGTLSLQMGAAHPSSTDTTLITLTVSDGITTDTKTFSVHVDNYVMSMYPALAVSKPLACILCHANVQADIVSDFGVSAANYSNANNILGWESITASHFYRAENLTVPFTVTGSLYMPDITVTDKNFIKQVTGNANGSPINFYSFLTNSWTAYPVVRDAQNGIIADTDGYVKIDMANPTTQAALPNIQSGIIKKNEIKIRAPSDAEILALDSSLTAGTTAFVYKGPSSKPTLSGLEIKDFGYGSFVRNSGTIVCYGSIIISGTLHLNNPDIETNDVGCSIYVMGNVFIETNRATAVNYVNSTASPTLQITSSKNIYMGVGLYDIRYIRGSNNAYADAQKIVNAANPRGLREAGGTALSIKSNENAGAWEYMTCPLRPEHALYLDSHYVSDGNYTACDASTDTWNCAMAKDVFNNWVGVVSNYNYMSDDRTVYYPASGTLINALQAYELMCRKNGSYQMGSYGSYSYTWAGYWGEKPEMVGSATINSLRVSTVFDHIRVNAQNVHSRYYGEFRGSVISPYALFAIGNLIFKYDTRLNNVVPFPKLMSPNPIFEVK